MQMNLLDYLTPAIGAAVLLHGVAGIKRNGATLGYILHCTVGILILSVSIAETAVNYLSYHEVLSVSAPDQVIARLDAAEKVARDTSRPLASRARASRFRARTLYTIHGRQELMLSGNGRITKFLPSEADTEELQQRLLITAAAVSGLERERLKGAFIAAALVVVVATALCPCGKRE